ncbi:MAG: hypothetical protein U0984_04295, partial [Prosthecobacter sp.]|nr:hypothetical protein [Prosthecobacter sp.]
MSWSLLLTLAVLFGSPSVQAALPLSGKAGWTTIMYGALGDPIDDSQAGAADTDIVGDVSHGSLYTMFDDNGTVTTSDDTLMFRMRIGNPTSSTDFAGVGIVGMDANLDGKIDLFMAIDGRNNTRSVLLMDPGTGANISPSTTSTSLLPSGWLASGGIYAFNSSNYLVAGVDGANDPHWNTDSDLDDDGHQDAFVTWRVPMPDLATVMAKPSPADRSGTYGPRGATGIAGYDQNTIVQYVNFTQTQHGPINGDLNGIGASYDKNATFSSLGAFTAPMSAANPVSASDKVTITKPVDANGYINAAEDDAFTVSGTATANGWVKLTISDTDAGTADVVVWVQADGAGAWSATGLDLSGLAEGTLTFAADLVTASGGSTIVTGATGDTTTAIHDTIPPVIGVDALATAGKPVISGTSTDIPAGSAITVSIDPNGDGDLSDLVTFTALVGAGGVWSVDTASVAPTSGTLSGSGLTAYAKVSATGSDAAGNSATAVAITKPTVQAQITNDTTPAITGTWGGTNGGTDTLAVTVNGVTYTTAGGQLIIGGNTWTLTIPGGSALTTVGSPYDVTATTTRAGTSVDDPTTVELQIVNGPGIAITSSSSQSNPKPTISGTSTIASGFITLVIDPNNDGNLADAVTYSVATDASGNWSLDTSSTLPLTGTFPLAGIVGTMGVTATATDSNGAQATATQALTITVRSLSLTSITATAIADTTGTINNADTVINRREDDAITVSGSSINAVGLTVTVTVADNDSGTTNPSGTATVQADGTWSVTGLNLSALRDGYLTFSATITGASASNTAYTHDATVPLIRFTTASTVDKNGGSAGGAITGSSDLVAGTVITVTLSSGGSGTATVDANGDWSYTHPSTASGSSIDVTATP